MLEMTSDAPTNVGNHVMSNIACGQIANGVACYDAT